MPGSRTAALLLLGTFGCAVTTFTVDPKNQLTNVTILGNRPHDGNGNVTSSGSVSYEYDTENQLVGMSSSTSWKFTFVYDGRGRLRKRQNYQYIHQVGYVPTDYWTYHYDGMRVIQERISGSPVTSYTRGKDLSGSLEGAGGIGGLLGRTASSTHNFYHADGNGNITYLVNSSQTLAASYRYDPYGNTISSSGSLAAVNLYRFSSKMIHVESGHYYYGYRWYEPNLQRWLNRDPISERGGINLYAYTGNDSVNLIDPFGQQFAPSGPIWPEHPGSSDAKGTQVGTVNTGNAPVRNAKPSAPLRRCSTPNAIQNKTPPYAVGECPCSGAEVTCYDWEQCEYSQVAQGLNGTIFGWIWVKHTECSECPEYGP